MKKFKLILSLIFMVGIMFIQSVNVKALPDKITVSHVTWWEDYFGGVKYGVPLQIDDSGDPVFCTAASIDNNVSSSQTCTKTDNWDESTKIAIGRIIYEASGKSSSSSATDDYVAAIIAINAYLGDPKLTGEAIMNSGTSEGELVKKYLSAAQSWAERDFSVTISASPSTLTFTKSGDTYRSNEVEITSSVAINPNDITINVGKFNQTGPNKYQAVISESELTGTTTNVVVNIPISRTVYYAREYTCGGYQPVAKYEETTKSNSATLTGTITKETEPEKPLTKVSVLKVDENGKALAGAEMQVKDSSGTVIDSWTSTTTAHVVTGITSTGSYYVVEAKSPDGYKLNTARETFTVSRDGDTITVKFENEPEEPDEPDTPNVVEILKIDVNGNKLPGAVLVLKRGTTVVAKWNTKDENPKIFDKLVIGAEYTIEEESAPEGYIKAASQKFTVGKNSSTHQIVRVKNSKKEAKPNKVIIYKLNEKDEKIGGAALELRDSKGNVIETWKTQNENPKEFTNLTIGETYTITEVSAPEGYVLNSLKYTFTVDELATVVKPIEIKVKNKPNKVEIIKIDKNTGKPLSGVVLQIQDKKGNVIKGSDGKNLEWTTDGKTHVIEKLNVGTYYVVEISTIDGYVLNKERKEFIIKETDETVKVTFENEPTTVEISKISVANGKLLPGATLEIQDEKGNIVKDSEGKDLKWVSTDEPYIIKGLKYGTYYLVETIAPEGYELSKEKVKFEISKDKQPEPVKMENELVVPVPDTLSSRSTLLLCIAMFDIALGIGIVTYVKKNKVQE